MKRLDFILSCRATAGEMDLSEVAISEEVECLHRGESVS